MMNLRPFEIVLIGIFASVAIGGLIFVSFYRGGGSVADKPYGEKVIVWGTQENKIFYDLFNAVKDTNKNFSVVEYVQKDPLTFDTELVNAIADGKAPDLVILPHEKLVFLRTKLLPISFETISARTFRDTYVDGAEIFMRSDGIYGIPFGVDPLVLYWNRDMFSSNGLANAPRTWEQLVTEMTPAITKKDALFNITKSAISFGEFSNISHPKQILAMLLLQAGSTIVNEEGSAYRVTLNTTNGSGLPPGDAVLAFYTQFSNATNENYSWNRSLMNDRLMFLGGDLGMYVGLGSELGGIQQGNPNLNFDVASIPQGSGATTLRNYGDFYAFAIPRTSTNQAGAYLVAQILGSEEFSSKLADAMGIAPVRRPLVAGGSPNPFKQIIYQSALISRGWLDPDPAKSNEVFKQMIEDTTSGRVRISDVIRDTARRLELLFK